MKAAVGPDDLHARAAEQRDHEAGDDRRVQPVLRRDADGDGERHRQRQRHDADHQAGQHVLLQVAPAVALAQHRAQRRGRQLPQGQRCAGVWYRVRAMLGRSRARRTRVERGEIYSAPSTVPIFS